MLVGSYNSLLVVFFLVAVLASYTALDLVGRIRRQAGRALVARAATLALGLASVVHFVGMLAFDLPIDLGYDVRLTLLSR